MVSSKTLKIAIHELTRLFHAAGLEQARLDARLIVMHAAGYTPEAALTGHDRVLSTSECAKVEALKRRRLEREPIAYLLGHREFWSLNFHVSSEVLIPRPDTETLVSCILDRFTTEKTKAPLRILDLGTGSGCILIALLKDMEHASGVGVDLSESAIAVARNNARIHDLSEKTSFFVGDWTESIQEAFDIVVSNPPYIPSIDIEGLDIDVRDHEPRAALDGGEDGLAFYRRLAKDIPRILSPNGFCAVEIGTGQSSNVQRILHESGLKDVSVVSDLVGLERVVFGYSPS